LDWTRPQHDIALAAIRVRIRLVPLAVPARTELHVVLEGLDLDGSGAHNVTLDPANPDAEALHVVIGLLRQKLREASHEHGLDAGTSGLSFTLAQVDRKLLVGIVAQALPLGANPAARLEGRVVIANIPLDGAGSADVLPLADIAIRAPGGASPLVAPGGNFSV